VRSRGAAKERHVILSISYCRSCEPHKSGQTLLAVKRLCARCKIFIKLMIYITQTSAGRS